MAGLAVAGLHWHFWRVLLWGLVLMLLAGRGMRAMERRQHAERRSEREQAQRREQLVWASQRSQDHPS